MRTSSVFLLAALVVAGCGKKLSMVTVSEPRDYTLPEYSRLEYRQSRERTWSRLLDRFTRSDFRVQEINAGSTMLKARTSAAPDKYLDCGSRKISTDDRSSEIENAAPHYQYNLYRHNHLDTHHVKNDVTADITLIVQGNALASEAIVQIVYTLDTHDRRTTTQGTRFTTVREYSSQLTPEKPVFVESFGSLCRSRGILEEQMRELLQAG